jgi:diphthine-ammonia ligase
MGNNPLQSSSFFCSWSGGKDSCLALYHTVKAGGRPEAILTMMMEDGERSRSHGLPVSLIRQQAESLGIPLVMRSTSWEDYESNFVSALYEFEKRGLHFGVFGDIDLDGHRQWCERVCSKANMKSYHPLWKRDRTDLLHEFIDLKFKAMVIAVKQDVLDKGFLGRTLDHKLILKIAKAGSDPSGEAGEYHTFVTDGPLFSFPIDFKTKDQVLHDGYWFLEVGAVRKNASFQALCGDELCPTSM